MRLRLRLCGMRLRLRRRWTLIRSWLSRMDAKSTNPSPGLYAYTKSFGEASARVHLRIEPDKSGLLMINANRAVHLNPSATLMAWLSLEGLQEADAVDTIQKQFRVTRGIARRDLRAVRTQLEGLINPEKACPIHDLDLELLPPFSEVPSAPYRMDLALTYRCNENCAHCYNARPRSYPEMDTSKWLKIIDRLWEIGVPHICFTGGEATLRDDLPELISHAESKGQITGLLTNGRRLSDRRFVDRLKQAGLDHVQITIESHDPEIHDQMVVARGAWRQTVQGIKNTLASDMFVMTNTTLLAENAPVIDRTLDFLAKLGVPTVGCNALIYAGRGTDVGSGLPEADLAPLLETVREKTQTSGQRLIWYTPTQYCHFDPVQMELGVKGCTAAMYNMCVEPNGGVIPCQSFYDQLGNILNDPWESIWNHKRSIWFRERQYVPEACNDCLILAECGGGCPLTLMNQSDQRPSILIELPETIVKI